WVTARGLLKSLGYKAREFRLGELELQWVNYLVVAFATLLLIPVAVLCAECLAALLPSRKVRQAVRPHEPARRPRIAVLVPAHDEEVVLAGMLASVMPQVDISTPDADRVVVVADNCSDDTARIARSFGAIVLERSDAFNRGKGF